jgi:hypothetical protein
VRQVFYRLVGAHGYAKTEQAYGRLVEHLGRARRAELIPFDSLRDDGVTVMSQAVYEGLDDFEDEIARRARGYRRDRQAGQPVRIELWCEAAGMMPQLHRAVADFSVPVYSAGGFASLTAVRGVVDRALALDGPLVLLQVGDLDPSGTSIFEHLCEDAMAFLEEDRVLATQRIVPVRVALTPEQIAEHHLPTAPPKKSDSRSARWTGGTCQLEALPPDVLADLVRAEVLDQLDLRVYREVVAAERRERAELLGLPGGE